MLKLEKGNIPLQNEVQNKLIRYGKTFLEYILIFFIKNVKVIFLRCTIFQKGRKIISVTIIKSIFWWTVAYSKLNRNWIKNIYTNKRNGIIFLANFLWKALRNQG